MERRREVNEASFGSEGAESTSVSASNLCRWLRLYLGYHEWYEQLRMCDLVIDGKGRTSGDASARSGDGDLSNRSAFAIGMAEKQLHNLWDNWSLISIKTALFVQARYGMNITCLLNPD